jgi:iron complex outermembrane receptor protein
MGRSTDAAQIRSARQPAGQGPCCHDNPPGTFRRLNPATLAPVTPAVTTPMLETRPRIGVDFSGWGAAGNIDWKLGERLALQSISAYREYDSYFANDNDLSPLANSLGFGDLSFRSFSQELRLNGTLLANDRIHYTVGGFYMDQLSVYKTVQDLRYNATALTQFQGNDPVNADTTAVFGHLSYQLFEKLTANFGLRYTDEHKDYTFSRRNYNGTLSAALGAIDGVTSNYDRKQWDRRVNLQYQFSDAIMAYAETSTGFKGGGISPRPFSAAQAVPFNPEELVSYELGVKSDFFDRRLRVNASVFQSDYTDLQLTLQSCPQFGVGLPCAVVANAGDAEIRGVELEVLARPLDGLTIDAAFSYLDFEYTRINPAAGGPTRPTGPQFGMIPAYVPKQKWSAGAEYAWSLGDLGSLTTRVDAAYQGQLFANGANSPRNNIESYTIANARVAWKNGEGDWEAALELTNFTNEYYFLTRFDQFNVAGVSDGQPGRPREWGLTVRRNF